MKTTTMLKLAALFAIMTMSGAIGIKAATTNLVQNVTFDLTLYEPGPTNVPPPAPVKLLRVTTADLIAALGAATSNSFSHDARLVLVTDLGASKAAESLEIRDGTNTVDVSGYFTATNSELSVSGTAPPDDLLGLISGLGADLRRAHELPVTYDILYLRMAGHNLKARLEVSGFNTTLHTTLDDDGLNVSVDEVSASVAGTGAGVDGTPAIVQGTVSVLGDQIQVQ